MAADNSFFEFLLPDVGEGLEEAEVVHWKVSAGQRVDVNQPLVEIETAKSLVELPSPHAGTIVELLVAEGESIRVGVAIVRIQLPAPAAPAELGPERTAILVGSGPRSDDGRRRARTGRKFAAEIAGQHASVGVLPPRAATLAKPPVRKLARDLGIDLAGVAGTGKAGSITRQDLYAAARDDLAPSAPVSDSVVNVRETRTPIRGVRRATAAAMVTSAFTAPHVTEFVTVDVTASMRLLEQLRLQPEYKGIRLSPLSLLARAMCVAVRRTPEVNSYWDEPAQQIVTKHYVNLGIAAATDRGLLVPNVKDADRLSLGELAVAISGVAEAARTGRTEPAQMVGGTMSITNIGVFGIETGTPILPPGESAIVCLGAIVERPWVVDGELAVRLVTTLALSFDHRLIDGAQGSRFLADIALLLHEPGQALAWG